MKERWIQECEHIARCIKTMRGQLIGVAVDNDAKADAYIKYWKENHDHVEIVDRQTLDLIPHPIVAIKIRLKGQLQ